MPSLAQISVIAVASQCRSKYRYPILRTNSLQAREASPDYGWSKVIFSLMMIIQTFGAIITFFIFMALNHFYRKSPNEQFIIYSYVTINITYVIAGWFAANKNSICLLTFTCILSMGNLVSCFILADILQIQVIGKNFYPSLWPSRSDWSGTAITIIILTSTIQFIHKIRKTTIEEEKNRTSTFQQC